MDEVQDRNLHAHEFCWIFLGHLLKCRATVVSLFCVMTVVTETNEKLFFLSGLHIAFHKIYKLSSRYYLMNDN